MKRQYIQHDKKGFHFNFHVLVFCFFDGFGFSCSTEVESGLVNMYISIFVRNIGMHFGPAHAPMCI